MTYRLSFRVFQKVLFIEVVCCLIFQLGCGEKCTLDTDCYSYEICVDGRCEEGSRKTPPKDTGLPFVPTDTTALWTTESDMPSTEVATDTALFPATDTVSTLATDTTQVMSIPTDTVSGSNLDAGLDAAEANAVPEECLACHELADCIPSGDTFFCDCPHGLVGDGVSSCDDIDECAQIPDRCGNDIPCVNTIGGYNCICQEGYHYEGFELCLPDTPTCTTDTFGECIAIEIQSVSLSAARVTAQDTMTLTVTVFQAAGTANIDSVTFDHIENYNDSPVEMTLVRNVSTNVAEYQSEIPLSYDSTQFVNLAIEAKDIDEESDTDATNFLFVNGNIIDVGDGHPYTTIQAGIDAAGVDDLILIHPGIYTGEGNIDLFSGLDRMHIDTVDGADWTFIDLTGSDGPAFALDFVSFDTSISIRGLTIVGGQAGAISCTTADQDVNLHVNLYNMAFKENTLLETSELAPAGSVLRGSGRYTAISVRDSLFEDNGYSAIWGNDGVSYLIENATFTDNTGELSGAIYLVTEASVSDGRDISSVDIVDSHFENNTSTVSGAGAVTAQGLSISWSTFIGNEGIEAGAVLSNLVYPTQVYTEIAYCTFESNKSAQYDSSITGAGAIVTNQVSNLLLNDSFFRYNQGVYGGAVGAHRATITNCNFFNNTGRLRGGAVYAWGESTIFRSRFHGNVCTGARENDGGGTVYIDREGEPSTSVIKEGLFTNNYAGNGGAIYNRSGEKMEVAQNRFLYNEAAFSGGSIYVKSGHETAVADNTFYSNISRDNGGGIHIQAGTNTTISGCIFGLNTAEKNGGAVSLAASNLSIQNSEFEQNHAEWYGGGLACADGAFDDFKLTIFNGLIADNTALSGGGAIYQSGGVALDIKSSTIAKNQTVEMGTIYGTKGAITLLNSIVWSDKQSENLIRTEPSVMISMNYCNVDMERIDSAEPVSGDNNISADPLFYDPVSRDYHLNESSPCIDAGSDSASAIYGTDWGTQWNLNASELGPVLTDSAQVDLGYHWEDKEIN